MSNLKKYIIGDSSYELLRPVFGVLRHVAYFCRDAGESVNTVDDLKLFLKDNAGLFVAGLITPEGVHPADRDLNAIARDLDWVADPDLPTEVMTDFFGQPEATPEKILAVGSATNILAGMILPSKIARSAQRVGGKELKKSKATSQSSPEETLSSENRSSGDSDTPT